MYIKQGIKIFLLSVVAVTAVLAVSYEVILPYYSNEMLDVVREISADKKRIAAINEFYKVHNDAAAFEKAIKARKKSIDEMLPDKLSVSACMLELQRQAELSGVILKEVKPGKAKQDNNYAWQEVSVALEADFFRLNDFICMLEQRGAFTEISEIKLHAANNGNIIEADATLRYYALKI